MERTDYLKFYTETPKFTHEPGLKVMRVLMDRLGNPQDRLRCIHIAGTNGKGSCSAMLSSVLQSAGYRTGLFTSPDLTGLWERIRINGVDITIEDLAEITERIQAACAGLPEPSFFEKITAAAFLYFAQQECSYVVLETGLGGRIDATNIIKTPVCSVIMPIGYDHTALLGSTLSAIAGEKAGILKPGCPAVFSVQKPEALSVLEKAAHQTGSPVREIDINIIHPLSHSVAGQTFSYGNLKNISLPLLGAHQVENACAVIETAAALGIAEADIRRGLASASWPCRFEYFDGTPPVLLDGAHNAHGAAALAAGLRGYFPGQRFTMLMGVMADKDYRDILELMEPLAARFVCLAPDSSRALPAEELAALIRTVPAESAASPEDGLRLARSYGDPVCAFGSLYYIGLVRRLLV